MKKIPEERKQLILQKYYEGVEPKKISVYYQLPYATVIKIIEHYRDNVYPIKRACQVCGNEFEYMGRSRRIYCNDKCQHKAMLEKMKQRIEKAKTKKFCQYCGKEFITQSNAALYCSTKCRVASGNGTNGGLYALPETSQTELNKMAKEQAEKNYRNMQSISEKCRQAKELGMSYGEYVRYIEG